MASRWWMLRSVLFNHYLQSRTQGCLHRKCFINICEQKGMRKDSRWRADNGLLRPLRREYYYWLEDWIWALWVHLKCGGWTWWSAVPAALTFSDFIFKISILVSSDRSPSWTSIYKTFQNEIELDCFTLHLWLYSLCSTISFHSLLSSIILSGLSSYLIRQVG